MNTVNELLESFNTQSMRNQELQRQLESFCRVHKYDLLFCHSYGLCSCRVNGT